jgi:choice-of-anchor B domain-containing protein
MSTLLVNADGTGMVALETDRFSPSELRDADGSAVIVHALPDNYANIPTDRYEPDPDEMTLSTGDAGGRVACGRVPADPDVAESVDVLPRIEDEECRRGFAGPFRCDDVDLLAFLPMDEIGGGPSSIYGGPGNDVWGWTDPKTRREWVIAGRSNGTSFIDVSDPDDPEFVANLPAHGVTELHSDMKVYKNHAYIVKDGPNNGIQVFDLTRLRYIDDDDAPVTVDADTVYEGISNAHDIAINEDTGFAYAVGATGDVAGVPPCHAGGLHMVDIREPKNPTFAGCFDDDGYTHDVQCVIYHGPDDDYQGRELCFAANPSSPGVEDALTIVDVTDKSDPVIVGKVFEGEPNTYSHQGWLTEDHRYFLHDDESDNGSSSQAIPGRSRNRVFDVTDLENPVLQSVYHGETRAPVHNLYTRDRYMYNANYIDGLRIVDLRRIDDPGDEFAPETPSAPDHQGLREVGCFDTDPYRNDTGVFENPRRTAWGGSWSNYPYFRSGTVVVSGFDGLFLVKADLGWRSPWGDSGDNVCLP